MLHQEATLVLLAWIYGSRHWGQGWEKDERGPPDIDLAVEIDRSDDLEEITSNMILLRRSLADFLQSHVACFDLGAEGQPDFARLEFFELGSYDKGKVEAGATLVYSSE